MLGGEGRASLVEYRVEADVQRARWPSLLCLTVAVCCKGGQVSAACINPPLQVFIKRSTEASERERVGPPTPARLLSVLARTVVVVMKVIQKSAKSMMNKDM